MFSACGMLRLLASELNIDFTSQVLSNVFMGAGEEGQHLVWPPSAPCIAMVILWGLYDSYSKLYIICGILLCDETA